MIIIYSFINFLLFCILFIATSFLLSEFFELVGHPLSFGDGVGLIAFFSSGFVCVKVQQYCGNRFEEPLWMEKIYEILKWTFFIVVFLGFIVLGLAQLSTTLIKGVKDTSKKIQIEKNKDK
jgi:hypothetical protein